MKHLLCLMGQLCPLSNLYKTKLSAMMAVMALFMCLIAAIKAPAQTGAAANTDEIQPLQIGDTIPEELWHLPLQVVNHPEGKETITLNDYRGKLIILDFWGTFCTSCIAAMPKIAEVQGQFAEDMAVVPVSWSRAEATETTLQTHQSLSSLSLFSVVEAQQLIETFPHGVVPHYAWINSQGKVVATTATNDVTHANIDKVLEGEEPDYALAKFIDPDKPLLFAMDDLPAGAYMQQYSVFIRGAIPGVGSTVRLRKTEGDVLGMAIYNRKISTMYHVVATNLMGGYPGKKLVFADSIRNDGPCSFDFIIGIGDEDSLYSSVLDFLNWNSGYVGQLVTRSQTCLALIQHGNKTQYISNEGERYSNLKDDNYVLKNYPIRYLISRLNQTDISADLLVLDETGYFGNIDITLTAPFDDMANIRRQLNAQGLDLIEVEREVEVFEIRERLQS